VDAKDVAIEELRQLQTVIGRMDQLEFQVRAWLLALLGALVAAKFSHSPRLSSVHFLLVGSSLTLTFVLMELVVRIPKRKAINRAFVVEEMLRSYQSYDGPKISLSLSTHWGKREILRLMIKEAIIWPVLGFYVPVVAILIIIATI